jgi:asparagine synthase (glutamine-hydrolysing)
MCGINGFTWEDEALAQKMNIATKHRGPDGSRVAAREGVTFGFDRLAIIDLSERGMQPMNDASGRFTLVFNGEIYNYRELKNELVGYPWKSTSDTEVILAAYAAWGRESFARFNGMFALALWDREARELVLARDSAGVKPLYYYEHDGTLMFSSELPALLAAGVPRTLDTEALGHYLRLKYVPGPMTMIRGIRKLMPGGVLIFREGRASLSSFVPNVRVHAPASYEDAKTAVRATIEEAVRRQLVADVPVGLYLSGGIDSSVILACASAAHPRIDTFSVGFDLSLEEEREKFNADSLLAKRTASHFGATHHEYLLSSGDVLGLFSEMALHMSEPIGNPTALAQLYLARKTRAQATVVLTGDGGDEMFGGYERYRLALLAQHYGRFLPPLAFFEKYRLRGVQRFSQLMFEKDKELSKIIAPGYAMPDTEALFRDSFRGGDIADELMRADESGKGWLVGEALLRADNMSMAASLEARVPFLDEKVRALAHVLPRPYKVTGSRAKKILKDAFADVLPRELLSQPKRGWFSPGAKWLRRNDVVRFADDVFSPGYAPDISDVFDIDGIRALWLEHRERQAYHSTVLWSLLVFFNWARQFRVRA